MPDQPLGQAIYEKFYKKDMSFPEFSRVFKEGISQNMKNRMVKIRGPHFNLVPSKDHKTAIIHSIGIAVLGIVIFLATVIFEKVKAKKKNIKRPDTI